MKYASIICLMGLMLLGSCSKQALLSKKFTSKHWLNGAWKLESSKSTVEQWKYYNKSLMQGKVFSAVQGDTIIVEQLKLEKKAGKVYYSVALTEPGKIPFVMKLKSETKDLVVFENQKDEYPQMISYKLTSPTTLTAIVEGTDDSKQYKKKEFKYVR